jgi:large subunit ribosomal protein L21
MASSYAIVESGGKQYRAEKGATLLVEHLSADEGQKVTLRPVMYRGEKDVVAGGADLEKVKVEAVVAEHLRGPKVRIFKYKPKKGYRRRGGHRQELTRLEVTAVQMLQRRPAAKKQAGKGAAEEKPAAKKAAEKKPAARKAAAKKPARKTAAKKSPAKKPASRGKSGSTSRSSSSTRRSSAKKS